MPVVVDRVRTLEAVSVPSAADVVVAQLTRVIELGRLLPGDRLPPERELAMQLGISRVTLRAALGELEKSGLVERVGRGSGGGALVVSTGSTGSADREIALRGDLVEIYELRVACESAAADLAATRRTYGDLERLERSIDDLQGELTPGRFRAADNAFHLGVADASGNRRLRGVIEDARAAMFRPLDAMRFELVVPSTVEHHRRILDAIAAGDAEGARQSTIAHLREAQREMLVAFALAE